MVCGLATAGIGLPLQEKRMTAARKQLELLQLAASVQSLKSAFNGRFAALRSLKVGGLAAACEPCGWRTCTGLGR
jgi:hypothetical protein